MEITIVIADCMFIRPVKLCLYLFLMFKTNSITIKPVISKNSGQMWNGRGHVKYIVHIPTTNIKEV